MCLIQPIGTIQGEPREVLTVVATVVEDSLEVEVKCETFENSEADEKS